MTFEARNTPHTRENSSEHPGVAAILRRVEKILKESAMDPKNFIELYGEQNVAADLEATARLKATFEHDNAKELADVLEAVIYEQIKENEWLGQNTDTIRPSEYDDLVNGVDLVAEFNDSETSNHLALGIDVTFGSDSMHKKFTRIRNEIHEDKLAVVKYYESHGFKGSLTQRPRVVIGVEIETVLALTKLWMDRDTEKLRIHFVKKIILEEIVRQLRTFLVYARSINSKKAVRSYTIALNTVEKIIENSNQIPLDDASESSIGKDRVYREIRKQLEAFAV